MEKERINEIIKHVVQLLVSKEFERLFNEDVRKILTAEMIEESISEYGEEFGGDITFPAEEAFENIGMVQLTGKDEMYVDFDLWFDNEQSDLTLTCSVIKGTNDIYNFSIENIHIM